VFHDVWVSTDDKEITAEAESAGAKVFHRSAETSSDEATSLSAVKEFSMYHQRVDIFAIIQCTSPFMTAEYLTRAYKMAVTQKFESVFSVTRSHKLRWKLDSGIILFLICYKNFNVKLIKIYKFVIINKMVNCNHQILILLKDQEDKTGMENM